MSRLSAIPLALLLVQSPALNTADAAINASTARLGARAPKRAQAGQTGAASAPTGAAPAQKPYVFRASSRLVVETVTVTTKDGGPLAGLTARDFEVFEDGVPQTIALFQYQRLAGTPPQPSPAREAEPVIQTSATAITPESAAGSRYQDRRLLVLYFDLTAMPLSDQLRSLQAAQKFITSQMQSSDLVAIVAYEGAAVKVKQDFTGDRNVLEQAIAKLVYNDVLGYDRSPSDAAAADTGTAFGQDDSEFNIFNTNRQLAAIQTAVNMLAPISEKKALVYFASGLPLNGLNNQAQLAATEDAAIRANVTFFPIDARGLIATAPLGEASQGSPGGVAMYSGEAAGAMITRVQHSQDTLYALAADTGGKAMFDTNDLSAGIARAERSIANYYIIGYYTTNPEQDGRYRRVRIVLKGYPGARLSYRTGYYMAKSFGKFTAADKERQLEDALMQPDPITDLTIDMEVNYFELNSAEYFVPIAAKIPGSELALAKAGGAQKSLIDFIGEVKDQYGTTITNLRDKISFKLSHQTAAQLAKVPVEFTAGFTLLPGEYSIKLLARDDETGRIGTYLAGFTIPNLAKETDRLPLSTVVLSNQRVPLRGALYNASKKVEKDPAERLNPLVQNGEELLPSVTHVFSRRQTMYVLAQAYERGQTVTEPLVAYVSFYGGAGSGGNAVNVEKALETDPVDINSGLEPHSYAVPIRFSIALSKLRPGRYTCQLSVLDPAGHKAAFWRAPIWILP
jgi:VWFA-related protein